MIANVKEAWRWLECAIWIWNHVDFFIAIEMKVAIVVAVYGMASITFEKADDGK